MINDEYKLGCSDYCFDSWNNDKTVGLLLDETLEKMLEIYYIYLIFDKLLIMGLK